MYASVSERAKKPKKPKTDISGFDFKHVISVGLDSEHTGLLSQSRDVHI